MVENLVSDKAESMEIQMVAMLEIYLVHYKADQMDSRKD